MPELIEDSKTSDGTKIMDEHIDALFQVNTYEFVQMTKQAS